MGLIEKIQTVLLHPSEFFENIASEKGFVEAFKYLVVLSLIPLAVNLIMTLPPFSSTVNVVTLGLALGVYLISLLLSFITAGILHLFAMLLSGKGDYSATYKVMAYSYTAYLLVGWIPIIGIVFSLYSIYAMVRGLSVLHKISMLRALVIVLALIVVVAVIAFIIGIFTSFWLFSFVQSSL